eukprot:5055885-Amphidinium_carterae.9
MPKTGKLFKKSKESIVRRTPWGSMASLEKLWFLCEGCLFVNGLLCTKRLWFVKGGVLMTCLAGRFGGMTARPIDLERFASFSGGQSCCAVRGLGDTASRGASPGTMGHGHRQNGEPPSRATNQSNPETCKL